MASKPKTKMAINERAKQFMPFAALKGLNEAMAACEKQVTEQIILSEEMLEELDRKMKEITPGLIITIIYYHNTEYLKKTGMVSKFDSSSRYIQVVDTKINFEDILSIEFMDEI